MKVLDNEPKNVLNGSFLDKLNKKPVTKRKKYKISTIGSHRKFKK